MGLIPDDVIAEIRDRADIVAVIGQHVDLRKAGHNHKGLCPFHQEKSPSFNVNSDKRFFYCFGCQKSGDVFSFVMEYEGKSFIEAAERLAAVTGVIIPEDTQEPEAARRQRSERARMLEINKMAASFYRQTLLDPQAGAAARAYLKERGIDDEVAEHFRLGFAPDDWQKLSDHLAQQGVPFELAQKVGLVARSPRSGNAYDRFRNRLMCPVIVPGGEVVGFSGRVLPGGDPDKAGAKYINSPESPVYKKSKLLFGLHRARDGFRASDRAVLVEGNFDVISLHQGGIQEAVAPLGTALTPEQVDQLRRLAKRVVLVYDGDKAGRAATLKALRTLVGADVDTYIASLPPGQDPDTYMKELGPAGFAEFLEKAQPAVEFFVHEVWSKSAASADGRARALQEAATVIRAVTNTTKRDLITGTLAAAMGVDIGLVRRSLARASRGQDRGPRDSREQEHGPSPRNQVKPAAPPPEDELRILAIIADHPQLLETAEEHRVFSLLTDERLRDMYSAARQGQPLVSAAPSELTPLIAKHVLAGAYAQVKDPKHCLLEALATLDRTRKRTRLAELSRQAQMAKRRGDKELERRLVREILTTRRQVD